MIDFPTKPCLRQTRFIAMLILAVVISGCAPTTDNNVPPGVVQPNEDPRPDQSPDPAAQTPIPAVNGTPGAGANTLPTFIVQLNNRCVQWRQLPATAIGACDTTRSAFLFNGNVQISGTIRRRVTIAAHATNSTDAATITITGDTGSVANTDGTLGLISQGDIVIPCPGGTPRTIQAALVSTSGSITIGRDFATPYATTNPPVCNTLNLAGSMASHQAAVLKWNWGTSITGFTQRIMRWDNHLGFSPPPYFPQAGEWKLLNWREANESCVRNPSRTQLDADEAQCS